MWAVMDSGARNGASWHRYPPAPPEGKRLVSKQTRLDPESGRALYRAFKRDGIFTREDISQYGGY